MRTRILILGAGVMQGPAIRAARARGWEAIAVDGDPAAACSGLADRFEVVDLKDKEGIEAFARSLQADGGLAGVMTAGTDFSASVAWVAERLALPGIPYEVALDASDKARMRARFRAAGVPSPDFVVAASSDAPPPPFGFPCVVKPVDNMGGRGCRRVDAEDGLRDALSDAIRNSRSGRAIVEEYMDGPEYSADALVHDGRIVQCGLADRHIFFPPYFIEMGHTMPTDLPQADARALIDAFERGIRALGIAEGAAKGDLKLTAKGPMIGEIAARLSGGYMSGWTYPYASGVEPVAGALSIAVGEAPRGLDPKRDWTCAERAYLSIPGIVESIVGMDAARSRRGVKDLFPRSREGDRVAFPVNNVTKCGNVIAADPDRAAAVSAAEAAARDILIRLRVRDAATDAFLAPGPGRGGFPPDAYAAGAAILGALDRLPPCAPDPGAEARLLPFPDLLDSPVLDYLGRTAGEGLDAVRSLTGRPLPIAVDGPGLLGRGFWSAFLRGGYQGAAYYLDCLADDGRIARR